MATKVLVYRDQERIEHTVNVFNNSMDKYKALVTEFAKLGIGSISSTEEFLAACTQPLVYIKDEAARTLTEQSGIGFKVKAHKLLEMAELPNATAFIEAARTVFTECFSEFGRIGVCRNNGNIEIDKRKLDAFIENCSIYAETKQEVEVFELLKSVETAAKRLIELNLVDPVGVINGKASQYLLGMAQGGAPMINLITFRKQQEKRQFI